MPLVHSKSDKAFKRNVRTLMRDVGKSPHVQSRRQALAIAYATKRRGKQAGLGTSETKATEKQGGGAVREPMQTGGVPDVRSFNAQVMQQNPMWGRMMPQLPSQAAPQAVQTTQGRGWGGLKGSMSQDPRFQGLREGFQSMWQQSPFGRLGEMFSRFRQHVPQSRAEGGRLNPFQFMGDPLTTEIDKLGAGMTRGAASPGPGRATGNPKAPSHGDVWWDQPSWHGTPGPPIKGSLRVSRGDDFPIPGVSLTTDLQTAGHYASGAGRTMADVMGGPVKGSVMRTQMRGSAKNYPNLLEFADKYDAAFPKRRDPKTGADPFQMATEKELHDFAKSRGYYGVSTPENAEYRVFDPANVRIIERADGGKIKSDEQREQEELIAAAGALAEDTPVMKALRLPVKKPKKAEGLAGKQGGGHVSPYRSTYSSNLYSYDWGEKGAKELGRMIFEQTNPKILELRGKQQERESKDISEAVRGKKYRYYEGSYQGGGKISAEFRLPWAARTAMYGLRPNRSKPLIGPTPGRADKRPENVASGSYVIPSDVVAAIGQGNSLAGMAKIKKKFAFGKALGGPVSKRFQGPKMESYGGGRFRMPGVPGLRRGQYALGGGSKDVPIAASDGEHILTPEEVTAFGGGDIKRGHVRLDKWVLSERKKHIEQLKRLKPPKRD